MASLPGLSLRRNFSWTLAGNVVYAGCQWAMLVILAKLGSPVMVGQFALGLAITAPVVMFSNLQLRVVQATDARYEYLFSDYLGLRIITTVLALIVIMGIALVAGYRWETAIVIVVVGLAKAFESISDVFYGFLQQNERMDRIAKSMMIKGPLSLVALGIGIYLTGSVLWGVVGLAIAWALILIGYDVHSGTFIMQTITQAPRIIKNRVEGLATLRPRLEMGTLRKLALVAMPLGFVMMLISLNTNIPRYFIEHYFGERELGIFAAMAYLMVAGNTVVSALGQSATPRLAKYYTSGNSAAFRVLLLKLFGIGTLLGVVGVLVALLAGREILTLLYRPAYADHTDVFIWLMIAAGLSYISLFSGSGMTAARHFRIQFPLQLFVVIVMVGASMILIPSYGMLGAAWATCIALALRLSLESMVITHALKTVNIKKHVYIPMG
ncbi:MAG: oligosaccharide flippase family protein [Actinobacteria bacterium]|nr:oligosaccharide flippase family protein [Actinomycetota bacterium]